jgi:hypothetical protein
MAESPSSAIVTVARLGIPTGPASLGGREAAVATTFWGCNFVRFKSNPRNFQV